MSIKIPGVASVDDEPASVADLYTEERIGTLAVAATLPQYRGWGCHLALTEKRMLDALHAGCDLIEGQAVFGRTSQKNMQKCGLEVAYTKSIWGGHKVSLLPPLFILTWATYLFPPSYGYDKLMKYR
ncbi:hypothetical protein [Mechercharimyces sp. CAU 1602]|uniref:hypothetical protein n=1 Tax=Mechercharimyces sp. CAU 1602 TaxID=2973933 RepID=UPI0021636C4D|nr:hypothetical protein [Mechercharimyces sp. CAU 1602]MCS1350129.1 hypothetical protein [Mechercharimyces sp. CAU 1602]